MKFELEEAVDLLSRTPETINALLNNLPEGFEKSNEGEKTWNSHEILRHLIYCEKEDWIPRMIVIMDSNNDKKFPPFDRFAHLKQSEDDPMSQLLEKFGELRKKNIEILNSYNINQTSLGKTGIHPEFGSVSLKQLLAAWTAHDLSHISQICRVIAKQYVEEVGPWKKYMRILNY